MNTNKLVLLGVAVVAIGIFALPSTVSLFAGQHVWYDISQPENNVPCIKCHADIYGEFLMSGAHQTLAGGESSNSTNSTTTYDSNKACAACHRVDSVDYTFASGDNKGSTPGNKAHAAATIACMACHEFGSTAEDKGPAAGGFAQPSYGVGFEGQQYHYTDDKHKGEHAAHNPFIAQAINSEMLEDSNEACLACHTYIPVKINWSHARSLEFNIEPEINTTDWSHDWNVTEWGINTSSYANATVWGNTTGYGNTTYYKNWPGDIDEIYENENSD